MNILIVFQQVPNYSIRETEAWEVCMAGSGLPKRACLH